MIIEPEKITKTGEPHVLPEPETAGSAAVTDIPAPQQQAGLIRQLLAERKNVVAYDNEVRVKQIDRQLKNLGYEGEPKDVTKDQEPVGRVDRPQRTLKSDPVDLRPAKS